MPYAVIRCRGGKWHLSHLPKPAVLLWTKFPQMANVSRDIDFHTISNLLRQNLRFILHDGKQGFFIDIERSPGSWLINEVKITLTRSIKSLFAHPKSWSIRQINFLNIWFIYFKQWNCNKLIIKSQCKSIQFFLAFIHYF